MQFTKFSPTKILRYTVYYLRIYVFYCIATAIIECVTGTIISDLGLTCSKSTYYYGLLLDFILHLNTMSLKRLLLIILADVSENHMSLDSSLRNT